MTKSLDGRIRDRTRIFVLAAGAYVALGGLISLLGYPLDLPRLTDWFNNGISIQPNATVCTTLAGLALILIAWERERRKAAALPAAIVALLGGATLFQWITDADLGIDSLLMFDRQWGRVGVVVPGRMGPPGSLSWTLVGVALLLAAGRSARTPGTNLVSVLSCVTLGISLVSLTAYLYGAEALHVLPRLTVIAFQTATFIFAVSLGILATQPQSPPMSWLLDRGAVGLLARRSLPVIILGPILLGWVRIVAQERSLVNLATGTALMVLAMIAVMATLSWWNYGAVARHEGAELAASNRLAGVLGSVKDALIVLDAQWRFTYLNDPAVQRLDRSRDELLGRGLWEIVPDAVGTEAHEQLHRAMAQRITVDYEVFYVPWQRWFRDRAYPNAEGGLTVFSQDITALKRAEEERGHLLEAERAARTQAEQAARLKDDFLATVSHELRTPLNAILGWAQVLKRARADEKLLSDATDALLNSGRMQAQLIDDLLDMNRIVTGKMRLEVQDLELARVIEETLATVHPAAAAKDIRIQTVLNPGAAPLKGDPVRLQQVFWNLLGNAVKFTPKGGKVQVVLERKNSHVEVNIADTGVGIKPEFLPHVFERFRQSDSSSTRQHGGLGLGLAIAKQIVELHGGSLAVSSDGEGKGATFRVQFPVAIAKGFPEAEAKPEVAVAAQSAVADGKLTGVRILVVDDDAAACDVLRRLLQACDAEVECVHSGPAALDRIAAGGLDVLLCDIGMPEMDGFGVMRRARTAGSTIPAIAVTAFARTEDRILALQAGFNLHLSKPVDARELVAAVASLVPTVAHA
jgi:PAS domain S-box-containing protein